MEYNGRESILNRVVLERIAGAGGGLVEASALYPQIRASQASIRRCIVRLRRAGLIQRVPAPRIPHQMGKPPHAYRLSSIGEAAIKGGDGDSSRIGGLPPADPA